MNDTAPTTTAPTTAGDGFEFTCLEEHDGVVVAIAIGESGRMYALCAGCMASAVQDGNEMTYGQGDWLNNPVETVTWHGTHILSAASLASLGLDRV